MYPYTLFNRMVRIEKPATKTLLFRFSLNRIEIRFQGIFSPLLDLELYGFSLSINNMGCFNELFNLLEKAQHVGTI